MHILVTSIGEAESGIECATASQHVTRQTLYRLSWVGSAFLRVILNSRLMKVKISIFGDIYLLYERSNEIILWAKLSQYTIPELLLQSACAERWILFATDIATASSSAASGFNSLRSKYMCLVLGIYSNPQYLEKSRYVEILFFWMVNSRLFCECVAIFPVH